jgi:hypothetical protein
MEAAMPSPFPGMDPYLESPVYWPDFHLRFINYWCEAIADLLPSNYEARMDERVKLVEVATEQFVSVRPDVAVMQRGELSDPSAANAGVATLVPVTIPLVIEEESRESFIKIVQLPHRSLVAVLELLSPSNKEGAGRADYLAKRNALLLQDVHLVELDLLLGGRRLPLLHPLPVAEYFALVARADRRPDCEVYAWNLPDRLPTVPVPLRSPDGDVRINLAKVFNLAYDRGRYANALPYAEAPAAPLTSEQYTWVRSRIKPDS